VKILNIDHIGIAVSNLEASISLYRDIFDLPMNGMETVDDQHVKVAFFPVGETEIELLESTTEDGTIAKYIEKNGEGIQHIALRVENIDEAIAEMKAKGMIMLDENARYGAGDAKIAFIHPKSTHRVLIELSERR